MNNQIVYEYDKYITNINNITNTLNQYGVAIIPNILDDQECDEMKQGMWNYLETITTNLPIPIKKSNLQTLKSFKELYPKHSMLIQHWSIGHAQFIWNIRTNPKVIRPFEKIWNVNKEDLLVSFDGASFHFPPEITKFGWANSNKSWLHCDQSYLRNGFECVQGWINAFDTNPGDATLTILEGSHKYHADFANQFGSPNSNDWFILSQEHIDWYVGNKACVKTNIKCPAGSLVLWDSRTIHCGIEPDISRINPNYRCVVYVCYTPRELASDSILEKKIKAWEDLRTTSHYPHKPKLFPLYPNTWNKPRPNIVQIPRPQINDLAYRLIGYTQKPENL
jgi:ectoine hydroxylase-related dioxygenase (phytanoyl-CoA dioxygenase family)